MNNNISKFAELSNLIEMDPDKTYIGGGYKRENIRIHDIVIENKSIRAYCDIKNDYSDSKHFHLTQMAAYSCSCQLLIAYFSYSRNIKRHAKGFHTFLSNYSIEWNRIIKISNNIPVEVREMESNLSGRTEKVNFKVTIGDNNAVISTYNLVFRLPQP